MRLDKALVAFNSIKTNKLFKELYEALIKCGFEINDFSSKDAFDLFLDYGNNFKNKSQLKKKFDDELLLLDDLDISHLGKLRESVIKKRGRDTNINTGRPWMDPIDCETSVKCARNHVCMIRVLCFTYLVLVQYVKTTTEIPNIY